jgi:broad specificity phosphatase PhoE
VTGAAEGGGRGELLDAVAREVAVELRQRKSPIAGFRPQGATAGVEILDELREVNRIVFEKAAPDEAAAFRDWLHSAAKEAAGAAKEGGFMGFRAERVSEGEQRMLDRLAEVLSAS